MRSNDRIGPITWPRNINKHRASVGVTRHFLSLCRSGSYQRASLPRKVTRLIPQTSCNIIGVPRHFPETSYDGIEVTRDVSRTLSLCASSSRRSRMLRLEVTRHLSAKICHRASPLRRYSPEVINTACTLRASQILFCSPRVHLRRTSSSLQRLRPHRCLRSCVRTCDPPTGLSELD